MLVLSVVLLLCAHGSLSLGLLVNHCAYEWMEEGAPGVCRRASDCIHPEAVCLYSLFRRTHLCCQPVIGRLQPQCPSRLAAFRPEMPVLCNPDATGSSVRDCPYGYVCRQSITDFARAPGQAPFLCCRAEVQLNSTTTDSTVPVPTTTDATTPDVFY